MYDRITLAEGGGDKKPAQDQFQKFGNWTNSTSTLDAAKDLVKRGLVNGQQLVDDVAKVNAADPSSIRNSQSDWKVAAIQNILANARKFGIKNPEAIAANKNALMSTLNPQYRDAINSKDFNTIHPNFWHIISNSILPEQYAKEESAKLIAKK